MFTSTSSKSKFKFHRVADAAQQSATVAAVSSPFNGRGVIDAPAFTVARPNIGKSGIDFAVRAHPVAQGWIAEATWQSQCGHLPFDGRYPHAGSAAFKTRSEAVDDALNRGLRQVLAQLGVPASGAGWAPKIDALRGVKVIDLFAGGLGGFGMGLASLGARVELACEIDPRARATYARNVRPAAMHADVCTLDGAKLQTDILTVGLLCQAFSKAGKRRGFADPALAMAYRHTLRLLGEIDAKVVIVECARQFLTQELGKDADAVRDALMRAGYRVQHRTLNAAGFGVAQSRERSFIVATRLGLDVDDILGFAFPEEQAPIAVVEDILEPGIPHSIDARHIVLDRVAPVGRSASPNGSGWSTVTTGREIAFTALAASA